jgi:hypothetical protein
MLNAFCERVVHSGNEYGWHSLGSRCNQTAAESRILESLQ